MLRTVTGVLAATIIAFSTLPTDAAKKKRSAAQAAAGRSLDGRVTGYPRTCWHDYYLYDSRGVPLGPYCH
jgi:hypothetical protein